MRLPNQIRAVACTCWVGVLGFATFFAHEADLSSRAGVIREGSAGGTRLADPGAQDAQSRTRTELPHTGERHGQSVASPGPAGKSSGKEPGDNSPSYPDSAFLQSARSAPAEKLTRSLTEEARRGSYSQAFEGGAAWKDTRRLALAGTRSPEPALVIAGIKPGHHLRTLATSAAELCGVDPAMFWSLVMRESSGRHWDASGRVLRSSSNALGLGQIKASTARGVSPHLDPMTPWGNALASACYYRQMLTLARGNVRRALVYYHRGPNAKGPTPRASREYASDIIEGSAQ